MFESTMSPSMRSFGRSPATTCRSEAPRSVISSRSWRRFTPSASGAEPAAAPAAAPGTGVDGVNLGFGPVIVEPVVGVVSRRAGFADYLVDRRDALHNLEPPVHAQRQHPIADR